MNSNLVPIKKNSPFIEKFNFIKELKKIVQKYMKKKNTPGEKSNIFQTTSVNTSSTATPSTCSNSINLEESKNNINISNLSCTSNISSIKTLLEKNEPCSWSLFEQNLPELEFILYICLAFAMLGNAFGAGTCEKEKKGNNLEESHKIIKEEKEESVKETKKKKKETQKNNNDKIQNKKGKKKKE